MECQIRRIQVEQTKRYSLADKLCIALLAALTLLCTAPVFSVEAPRRLSDGDACPQQTYVIMVQLAHSNVQTKGHPDWDNLPALPYNGWGECYFKVKKDFDMRMAQTKVKQQQAVPKS